MNLQWLASSEWTNIVQALLHTLWQGAIIAVLLGFALRRLENPVTRYRCALTALGGVMLAGLVTWSVLNRPLTQSVSNAPLVAAKSSTLSPLQENNTPVLVVNFPPPTPESTALSWTAWLALVWLVGAIVMLGRAGFQVAGAERLRRASRPLADTQIIELLNNARQAVGLARRVRLAVTDKLTSPAVVGVLVPTLILPLSLTTTLTAEQIRFVLLHELAHVRRGDYIAGLFQLFAEALLFFNPAIWWISRQVRIEREVCCDTLAVELSGAPVDYARTLVHVAENILSAPPLAASAFGDKRGSSSLADRVQRMLVPGYRPALRLTWRAMLFALLAGGGLLFLSALGTRATIAAILSPQERIDRIEKKMTELGEKPVAMNENGNSEAMPQVQISGTIRTGDGSPLPQWVPVNFNSKFNNSSYVKFLSAQKGLFTNSIRPGSIYLSAEVTNFALTFIGPLDGLSTNRFENLEIVLQRGFDVPLQMVDVDSGKPVLEANVSTIFRLNNQGSQYHFWKSSADGSVTLTHCADLPMDVMVKAPGYEIVQKRFEHLRADEPLKIAMKRGLTLAGVALDQVTGQPLAGAEVRVLYETGATEPRRFEWNDALHMLGKTDSQGAFILNQLALGVRYYLGVSAPEHESIILKDITAGQSNLVVRLGPELIIRGHVLGNLDSLQQNNNDRVLSSSVSEKYGDNSYGNSDWVPLHITNGVATFQFTNRTAGLVKLSVRDGGSVEREVSAPVDDWVVDLDQIKATDAKVLPKREVIFRFQNSSGVSPRGTVQVMVPNNLDPKNLSSFMQDMEITNGEVHAQIAIGGQTSIEPRHMVGYWFSRAGNWTSPTGESGNLFSIQVRDGSGPLIIDIPLVPAGAIYAKGRNADGTPANQLFFGVTELKRAPGRDQNSLDGGANSPIDAPRQWISGPLPLGGKYQIHAWRGNSFCVSQPVKLTESNPDAAVELQFAPGKKLVGTVFDADGRPVRVAELKAAFTLADNHGFGLKSLYTDEHGQFELADATPDVGEYSVEVNVPGMMAVRVPLDFNSQPQTIHLQRGRSLAGQVVEAGTGYPIPDMELRALDYDSNKLPMLTTHTDADGCFEFTTLGNLNYTLYPDGGELIGRPASGNLKFRADGRTNLMLKVKLYPWSKVKPKMPAGKLVSQNTGTTTIPGISTNPKFTAALRELEKRTGTETLTNPEPTVVTSHSGSVNTMDPSVLTAMQEKLSWTNPTPVVGVVNAVDAKVGANLTATNLFTRTFKIDTKTFYAGVLIDAETFHNGLQSAGSMSDIATNFALAARNFFTTLGVDLESPKGKSVFYNDRLGLLFVKATQEDLDTIDGAIQVMNQVAPQVHIKARFIEVTAKVFQDLAPDLFTNAAMKSDTNGWHALLTNEKFQTVLHTLEENSGGEELAEPEVVTTTGRQTQMRATQILTIVTNMAFQEIGGVSSIIAQTNSVETGPMIDLIPYILADGYTINLTAIPSLIDFLGYDESTNTAAAYTSKGERADVPVILPTFSIRQIVENVNLFDNQTLVFGKFGKLSKRFNVNGKEAAAEPKSFKNADKTKGQPEADNKELLVFVTATIVDPAGNLVHNDEELPFAKTGFPPPPH